jgi:glycine cleavage system H protein
MHECRVLEELLYDAEHHVWVKEEEGGWRIGMTDAAQALAGPLAKITPKPVGTEVKEGKALAIVESGKWVGPLPAPFPCKIIEVNEVVTEYPGVRIVNSNPYEEGWILKVEASNVCKEKFSTAEEYKEFLKKERIECK